MTTMIFDTKTVEIPRVFSVGQTIYKLHDAYTETREVDNGEVEKQTKIIEHPIRLEAQTKLGKSLGFIEVTADGSFKTEQGSFSLKDGLTSNAVKALAEAF